MGDEFDVSSLQGKRSEKLPLKREDQGMDHAPILCHLEGLEKEISRDNIFSKWNAHAEVDSLIILPHIYLET